MRSVFAAMCCLLMVVGAANAQSDRGTITGTIADPAGAAVSNASIEAKNTETGALYPALSTTTGNYTISQLPVGVYELSVSVPGFKKFVQTGITVMVAQTLRVDVELEIGEITETVTVSADAPLLRTESGELSENVTAERLNELPIFSVAGGIRNPYRVTDLLPGASSGGGNTIRIQGAPAGTQNLRIEGQDATSGFDTAFPDVNQPSVEAVEEFSIQTSNFAAEYGQAGSSLFNLTMRSGTNTLHGSAYIYYVNEAFNASEAYINGREGYTKPTSRRHNYGFSVGGPVYLPGIYDGRDRTFFFFNFEQNRAESLYNNLVTVPTEAFRNGDFSAILTGRELGTDPLGRTIYENQIYNPATERTEVIDGVPYLMRDPFEGNIIPTDRFDSVAAAIQDLIPAPTETSLTNNYQANLVNPNNKTIPSVKVDHNFGNNIKLSGYWSFAKHSQRTFLDGLDWPGTQMIEQPREAHTVRINYDHTITPTMLLHLGAGYMHEYWAARSPEFDPASIGLKGTYVNRFPVVAGLWTSLGGHGSRSASMGPNATFNFYDDKPTANASFTWVKNNHTFKFGAEAKFTGNPIDLLINAYGTFVFNRIETGLPALLGTGLQGGSVGFPYASFLLGRVNSGQIGKPADPRMGKQAWALFAQDAWKVTRKLTLDYGLRWDYQTYLKEQYGRVASISADVPNPAAGNLPGGVVFEQTLGRDFAKNYKYAFGPRLGLAYQITPKTVLRAGWGISYGQTAPNNFWSRRFGSYVPFSAPSYGEPAMLLEDGVPVVPVWPNFDPGQFPVVPSSPSTFLHMIDPGAGRPPRLMMWSIGLQREITPNLSVEAAYVGNRGVWWGAGIFQDPNRLTPEILATHGLDISNADDRALLNTPLKLLSPENAIRFPAPYPDFSTGLTVGQSIRPFPQFLGINVLWSPVGNSWYDALQIKVTKRYSQGLSLTAAYSWQKELNIGAETEDPNFFAIKPAINNNLDRASNKYISAYSQPHRLVIAANYTTPSWNTNKVLSWIFRDWTIGAMLTYASGRPIQVPYANNEIGTLLQLSAPFDFHIFGRRIGTGTFANRVPGQPLFTTDINCTSCFDPNQDFVLNPDAWEDPPAGQFGTSAAYYNDYRQRRRPSENMSFGREFRLAERAKFSFRFEFTNIFNRIEVPSPSSNNAGATQTSNPQGVPISGFGYINTRSGTQGRTGQIVARIEF
jgi:outer membrane receptor protein involved in Fe transport